MSLKRLFGEAKQNIKVNSRVTFQKYLEEDVESIQYIEKYVEDRSRFKPHVDYLTASNFATYGSLEEYYEAGISRIQDQYPYDGSLKEKLEYFDESSGFDEFLFSKLYPRTNGYITISSNRPGGNGWGNLTSTSGAYGNPATKEYILVKGGPNIGNVYKTSSHQSSNLEIDGLRGNTVEFLLNKSEYVTTKTSREVVFDFTTTGSVEGNHKYGRMSVELDNSDASKSPFLLTYQSASSGFKDLRVGLPALYASGSDSKWHHYSFTFQNHSGSVRVRSYIDGQLHQTVSTGSTVGVLNTAMVGAIGSLVAYKDQRKLDDQQIASSDRSQYPGRGYGKLSGSLDEFRFWKVARNSRQVSRFWMTNVGAGSNTTPSNSPLGIYYKFNEGIVGVNSKDKNILDYSGRLSNGLWVGYAGYGRSTSSAIVESKASLKEFKDPIIYKDHPQVVTFTQDKKEEGYAYDLDNNSSLFYSIPDWIVQEDGDRGDLRKITQIMGSYFDSLNIQVKELTEINKMQLKTFSNKPYPFNDIKLESLGLVTPDVFLDTSVINVFLNRNEDEHFKQPLAEVKNFIYNNIHNNINAIYKSKGTERSFRN